MQIYYFETPNPRKVCAVAKHLGLDVDYVRVDLFAGAQREPAFLAVNPNGKVPVLVDGHVTLWESGAIMAHLARRAESELWPSDPAAQVEVLRWLLWDTAHFSRHAGTLYFERHIRPTVGMGETDEAAVEEASGFFAHFAGVLDQHLRDRDYLLGDALSVADFAVAALLPNAAEAGLPLAGRDAVHAWHERLLALPAWREPFPAPSAAAA